MFFDCRIDLEVRVAPRRVHTPGNSTFPGGEAPPVESLAVSFGERALAVVLGGRGVMAWRAPAPCGAWAGSVLVGDSSTADPADLPRAVMGAGAPDRVVSPHDLGRTIADLLTGSRVLPPGEGALVGKVAERTWMAAERRAESIIERMGREDRPRQARDADSCRLTLTEGKSTGSLKRLLADYSAR